MFTNIIWKKILSIKLKFLDSIIWQKKFKNFKIILSKLHDEFKFDFRTLITLLDSNVTLEIENV